MRIIHKHDNEYIWYISYHSFRQKYAIKKNHPIDKQTLGRVNSIPTCTKML